MVNGEYRVMTCHAKSPSTCHATPANEDGRWLTIGSAKLRKCFQQPLGIVDHRWDDSRASTKVVGSFVRQRPMAKSTNLELCVSRLLGSWTNGQRPGR
jgi:hypothetical protein